MPVLLYITGMANTEQLQEQQYLAGEREAELAELRSEENEPPFCGACGTVLDEYGNCPAYPQTLSNDVTREREEEAWSLAADMLDVQHG
jgi:hypothetical protein